MAKGTPQSSFQQQWDDAMNSMFWDALPVCAIAILIVPALMLAAVVILRAYSARVEERQRASRCQSCGYLLRGLPKARCPECGTEFDPEAVRRDEGGATSGLR